MKFTIVFPSHEDQDLSIGAVFKPCLVWMEGQKDILIPHPEDPHYNGGEVKVLLAHPLVKGRIAEDSKSVTVIVHPTDYIEPTALHLLVKDLQDEGFVVGIVQHSLVNLTP